MRHGFTFCHPGLYGLAVAFAGEGGHSEGAELVVAAGEGEDGVTGFVEGLGEFEADAGVAADEENVSRHGTILWWMGAVSIENIPG